MRIVLGGAALVALALAAGSARAQERPRDEDIFGTPASPADAGAPADGAATADGGAPAPTPREGSPASPGGPATTGGSEGQNAHAPPSAEASRDEANLGGGPPRLDTESSPDNPLTIGGQIYLRTQTTALEDQGVRDWSFSAPSLLDAYFDARPNARVRGFVLGRMAFDPSLPPGGAAAPIQGTALQPSGATMGAAPLSSLFAAQTRGPQVALDQMWLRFDIKHTVFVTAGKQHVRWGTARFWTPTDFLHLRPRNPLDVFDARTGTTMLKLHLPWEERGWNLYAYGLAEGTGATPNLGSVAGAGRAEVVLGTMELGIGGLVQRGRKPKVGADLSVGIWDFDLYGEAALRYGSEIDRVGFDPEVVLQPGDLTTSSPNDLLAKLDARYPVSRVSGIKPQVVGGLSYSRQYADKDVWTIGVEYFYNALGYDNASVYPGLILPRNLAEPATFFYLGRHYGAVFLSLPAPYSWDLHTFTLSTLGNLSDRSFISRFDYSYTLLTHLRVEAFVDVRYGRSNGEFRFGIPELARAPALFDCGVALRVSI